MTLPSAEGYAARFPVVQPQLETRRLRLRAFELSDAPRVQEIVSRAEIARFTLSIPHPYPEGAAEAFLAKHPTWYEERQHVIFASVRKSDDVIVAAHGLHMDLAHGRAELGYWVAVEAWNQGYGTEAARAVVDFGFRVLGLERIFAHHFMSNPASGRILERIGMQHEGLLRRATLKYGQFEDVRVLAVLRDEWSRGACDG